MNIYQKRTPRSDFSKPEAVIRGTSSTLKTLVLYFFAFGNLKEALHAPCVFMFIAQNRYCGTEVKHFTFYFFLNYLRCLCENSTLSRSFAIMHALRPSTVQTHAFMNHPMRCGSSLKHNFCLSRKVGLLFLIIVI